MLEQSWKVYEPENGTSVQAIRVLSMTCTQLEALVLEQSGKVYKLNMSLRMVMAHYSRQQWGQGLLSVSRFVQFIPIWSFFKLGSMMLKGIGI